MTETLANGYSSESTQRVLSNEYQHDRVKMVFKNICVFVLWKKEASALEGLSIHRKKLPIPYRCPMTDPLNDASTAILSQICTGTYMYDCAMLVLCYEPVR